MVQIKETKGLVLVVDDHLRFARTIDSVPLLMTNVGNQIPLRINFYDFTLDFVCHENYDLFTWSSQFGCLSLPHFTNESPQGLRSQGKVFRLPSYNADFKFPNTSCQDHIFSVWDVLINRRIANASLTFNNENAGNLIWIPA